ncbi:MAG: zinc-dependent peptidase [Opitutaceae bacterium]|nr:zinc-dependent peptidase [Cytophagales bacterium]
MKNTIAIVTLALFVIGWIIFLSSARRKKKKIKDKLNEQFPGLYRTILENKVLFYRLLNETDKRLFEKRVQLFLATKKIEPVDTEIDDTVKLMVASSAIIPTFAFPQYNYPSVKTVLIYPNSFDEDFKTENLEGHKQGILGMVGNRFLDGTVLLSKPDLLRAYDGLPHKSNVGVHEFVHLLDKEDGAIDGIPERLTDHSFVGPWLHEIKNEIDQIQKGKSDIDPYALKNNAEFLAVVSEYFFSNPDKFRKRHPELYGFLEVIFNKNPTSETEKTE